MTHRTLTPAQNYYVETLARRILYIQDQVEALKHRPMKEIHETGLPVIVVLSLLMESAGWTDLELEEALS